MSPRPSPLPLMTVRFPRVSGDEPGSEVQALLARKFSPRERG